MAPTSQKAGVRPISFVLSNGLDGSLTSVNLNIRPEDLSRVDPSSMSATRTFGGAWLDNFGPGLSGINISGHTGWRGGADGDGVTMFAELRDTVFTQWHAQRAAARQAGQSPDVVQLIFADTLDSISAVVAPGQFTLKRSRTRPLLMMYQISMTVLDDQLDASLAGDGLSSASLPSLSNAVDSLTDSLSSLTSLASGVGSFLQADIVAPATSFLGTAVSVIGAALDAVGTTSGTFSPQANQLIGLAGDMAQAGCNAFYTYSASVDMDDDQLTSVMQLSSAFDSARCVLKNAFSPAKLYPDYSDVYGASNCSSTSGGDPLSPLRNENAFDLIVPPQLPLVSVSPSAAMSIAALNITDPVFAPMSYSTLAGAFSSIGSGVLFP